MKEIDIVDGLNCVINRYKNEVFETGNLNYVEMMAKDCKQEILALHADWEDIKVSKMEEIVRAKLSEYPSIMERLIETGDEELVEGNYWHDNTWGNCYCKRCRNKEGKNLLGKILMKVREEEKKR